MTAERPQDDSALTRCVGDADRFLHEHWGRRPHLHRGGDASGLLSLDDADHLLASTGLRAPAFRLVKGGATLDQRTWTRTARIGSRTVTDLIDVARVYDHHARGATIVLQGLHRYWPPVTDLCRALEEALTHPVQANAYITPPVAKGLDVHADAHDVFALQTHGRKQWVVYGDAEDPVLDVDLQPGNCLYLPTGTRHAARTVDSTSIHLTLGVRTVTWSDVLRGAIDDALSEAHLRATLPAGFARDPAALADQAAEHLRDLAERLRAADPAAALEAAATRFAVGRQPDLRGRLRQLAALAEIADHTVVRRRPGVTAHVATDGATVTLTLPDRVLRLPARAEPAVRRALGAGDAKVADLGDELDEAGRVTLARRMVREGLLMVADG